MKGAREGLAAVPVVGMACTEMFITDRHAATIIAVSKSGYCCDVQRDHSERTDKNGMSEQQTYVYKRDPKGKVTRFYRRKDGLYYKTGGGVFLALGVRRTYHDFSY